MIFIKGLFFFLFFLASIFGLSFSENYFGGTGRMVLDIQGVGIRHGTPNNLNLGTIQYSNQEQEITGEFSNYFWIEDLMGLSSGHYTSIQCDGLHGPNLSVITGVYLKAGNISPSLILGMTGGVFLPNDLSSYYSIYRPLVYLYKSTNVSNIGIINKYGDIPTIKVVVPANTTAGTYNGTITFSLYMN